MSDTMQRFQPVTYCEPNDEGRYVLHEAASARIAELERQVSALRPDVINMAKAVEPYEDRLHDLESALRELLQDTQHLSHNCGDGPDLCPVARARELLGEGV